MKRFSWGDAKRVASIGCTGAAVGAAGTYLVNVAGGSLEWWIYTPLFACLFMFADMLCLVILE